MVLYEVGYTFSVLFHIKAKHYHFGISISKGLGVFFGESARQTIPFQFSFLRKPVPVVLMTLFVFMLISYNRQDKTSME